MIFLALFQLIVPVNEIKLADSNGPSGYPEGAVVKVMEGITHIITCTVLQTRPAASIEWYINNIKIVDGITTPAPPSDGDNLVDATGSIRFDPTRDHHMKTLECRARIDIVGAPDQKSQSVLLEVDGNYCLLILHGIAWN